MKKQSVMLIASLVLTGFSCSASAAGGNVLGYTKITVPSNQYTLVALDFNNESNTIKGLFGNLPIGSKVYTWNAAAQRYNTFSKGIAGWGAPGTNKIERGVGAFVVLPTGIQTNMLLSGSVPTAGTTTVYKATGYSLISYPYPVLMTFSNTAIAKTAVVGDKLSIWQNNAWKVYTRGITGWPAEAKNLQLKPGQAFFFQSAGGGSANEIRPYTVD